MSNPERWFNGIIGPDTVLVDGERVAIARKSINFPGATQEDDPDNDRTNVTIPGSGGATPGGSEGDVQVKGPGNTFVGVPRVEFPDPGEMPVGAIPYWNGTTFAVLAPPDADGTYGIVWSGGIPTGWDAVTGGGGGGTFDPTTLAASHCFRASGGEYDGLPWAGTVTAGSSGSRSLNTASPSAAAPTAGTAVNGHVPAVFNTSATSAMDSTTPLSSLITATEYTILLVFKPTGTAGAPNASRFQEQAILAEYGSGGAYLGVGFSTAGLSAFHLSGGADYSGPVAACTLNNRHVGIIRFGSGTLGVAVDGGTEVTLSKGNVAAGTAAVADTASRLLIGLNYAGTATKGQTMELFECWLLPFRISDSDAAGYVAYAQAEYEF